MPKMANVSANFAKLDIRIDIKKSNLCLDIFCSVGSAFVKIVPILQISVKWVPKVLIPSPLLADPGEARGCSTNTFVIHLFIH